MLFPATGRFLPRSPQELAKLRREATIRAEVSALAAQIQNLEKEQQLQLTRIGQIQHQLDDITRLVQKLAADK
jgi:hypothetical protein